MVQNISTDFQNIYESSHSSADDFIDDLKIRLIGCGVCNTARSSVGDFMFPAFMAVYYRQGSVRIQYKENSFTLQPGGFYIFRPYEVYSGIRLSGDMISFSYLQFDIIPFMKRHSFEKLSLRMPEKMPDNGQYVLYGKILDGYASSDLRADGMPALLRILAKSIVAQIFYDQNSSDEFSCQPAQSRESRLINRTFAYVSEHMDKPVIIGDILRTLAVNKTSLERIFRRVLNETPQQAILKFKIDRAMEMLQYGESIKKTAEGLGFNSIYHFSNTFKRITGLRPTEYQKKRPV